MSEPGLDGIRPPPLDEGQSIQSSLASLRREGAHRLDPARFRYLEALSQRMQAHPAEVRRILACKLTAALAGYVERFGLTQDAANEHVGRQASQHTSNAPNAPNTPLTELNRYIRQRTQDDGRTALDGGDVGVPSEMKSVRRFSEVWSRIAAEEQVDQAFGRGPKNAGPLNSHMLVLRSLALMRELSPDYLRRFLLQVDASLWLDQVSQKNTLIEVKPARRNRPKK